MIIVLKQQQENFFNIFRSERTTTTTTTEFRIYNVRNIWLSYWNSNRWNLQQFSKWREKFHCTCLLLSANSSFFMAASLVRSTFILLRAASFAANTAWLWDCMSRYFCLASSASSMYLATTACCSSSESWEPLSRFNTTWWQPTNVRQPPA